MFSLDLSSEACTGRVIAPVYPAMAIHTCLTHQWNFCAAIRYTGSWRTQIFAAANTFSLVASYVARRAQIGRAILK